MRRVAVLAVLVLLVSVFACGAWNRVQSMKTGSCLAATARALHEDGAALERIRGAADAREWALSDRAQTSHVLATVRGSVGDCSAWAADGALLDAWGEPVLIEIARPAEGVLPFRLRSAGADRTPHTGDDVTYDASSPRAADPE
jgi:hypothetical protein